MLAYHFTDDTLRDGRPIPPVGEWLEHDGKIVPCRFGLHASEHPLDALNYAPGCTLHRVELEGDLMPHGEPVDKWVGRRRKIVATVDATALIKHFSRWCAIQVIHLWDAPEVVREYLETGREDIRAAARDAARDAAQDAEWDAAWDAARDAAWDAARDAARDAAWDAARDAARDAAWDAARAAASAAARDAARDAAWDAAWDAARAAAWDAQRSKFAELVNAAFEQACQ